MTHFLMLTYFLLVTHFSNSDTFFRVVQFFQLWHNRPINSVSNNRPQSEALGDKPHKLCIYFPEPRTEVYYLSVNFNISKLVYFKVLKTFQLTFFHCDQFFQLWYSFLSVIYFLKCEIFRCDPYRPFFQLWDNFKIGPVFLKARLF